MHGLLNIFRLSMWYVTSIEGGLSTYLLTYSVSLCMWTTSITKKLLDTTLQQCGIEQLQHCRSSANAPPTWIWCFLIPTLKTYMQKNVHVSTFRLLRGCGWLHWARNLLVGSKWVDSKTICHPKLTIIYYIEINVMFGHEGKIGTLH